MQIGIIGNYGATNVGDDAILSAILASHHGNDFTVFSANPELTGHQFNVKTAPLFPLGFRAFLRYGFWRPVQALRKMDVIILGGGGLFQDDRLYACFLWAWQAFWVYLLRKPLFVYAIGVGPLKTKLGRWLTSYALYKANVITVRDQASCELLRKIGLTEGEIHVTADPAFLLKSPNTRLERTGNMYLISLRPWLGATSRILEVFTEFLLRLKNEKRAHFIFVCMQNIREHDRQILEPLAKRVGGTIWTPTDFTELLAKMQTAEFAIGMRLHFLIAALIAGTPTLPISYSPKIEALFAGTPLWRYLIRLGELSDVCLEETIKRLSVDYNNVKVYENKHTEFLNGSTNETIKLMDNFLADLKNL